MINTKQSPQTVNAPTFNDRNSFLNSRKHTKHLRSRLIKIQTTKTTKTHHRTNVGARVQRSSWEQGIRSPGQAGFGDHSNGTRALCCNGPSFVKEMLQKRLSREFTQYWLDSKAMWHSKLSINNPADKYGLHLLKISIAVTRMIAALLQAMVHLVFTWPK